MKKWIIAVLMVLVACAPQPEVQKEMHPPQEGGGNSQATFVVNPPPESNVDEMVTQEASGKEAPMTPIEPTGSEYVPYSTLGCQQLLTDEEFASTCEVNAVVVSTQTGTKNCYINLKSRDDERLTADVSLLAFKNAEDAMTEFDRRAKVYNVGADKSVGDKAYTFPKLDRETLTFVRKAYLVEVGGDTHVCSKEQVKQLATLVDAKLK